MNAEDKKHYSEAIKNIVLATSIIVGGVWAYYTFDATLQVQNARAQLEKVHHELTQRPVLKTMMTISPWVIVPQERWLLKIQIEIQNTGNTDVEIIIGQEAIRVAKVKMAENVISGYQSPIFTGERLIPEKEDKDNKSYEETDTLSVLAGQIKSLLFLVTIEEPGLYQVDFVSIPGEAVMKLRQSIREKKVDTTILGTTDYVYIDSI